MLLKFVWNNKASKIFKEVLEEKEDGRLFFPNFKCYYKVIITKTVWQWNKGKFSEQWNEFESKEINPQI